MLQKLILGLVLVGPLYAQEVRTGTGKIATFTELSTHLLGATNGAIRPTHESFLAFRLNEKKMEATPILPEDNPDFIHSLFETDVEMMIRHAGVQDFVSAKKKYYGTQSYDRLSQRYSRSYIYPSDWMSLNHSPVRKLNLPYRVYGQQFVPLDNKDIAHSPLITPDFNYKLDEMTGTELTAGNKMRLLNNGVISFKEKVRMVKQTKKFFHSVVMIQYCDESNSEIVDAMIEKARAGVDARLMVEAVWTKAVLNKCLKKLRAGGVKVTLGKGFFNPKTMFTVHHTKFWIRDGEEAIIGGQNMHDFENLSNGFNNHTRDKDVHVTGPAVTDMLREYIRIWNHERGTDATMEPFKAVVEKLENKERSQGLRGKDLYHQWLNKEDVASIPGVCRVMVQGTKTTSTPMIITNAYIEMINNTKYSMIINTPTLRYNENKVNRQYNSRIVKGMLDAAKNGVKLDMISNGPDGGWGEAGYQLRVLAKKLRRKGQPAVAKIFEGMDDLMANVIGRIQRNNLAKIIKAPNVDSWMYFNHLHSKQMMFDHIVTSTGSFNLDIHSYKNHESTMICIDKKLADESLKGFVSDIVNSVPVL
jgi:phosphatidylserine/phosphatidylglycerophosphate/cardiolipin synthase-like enzyme